MFVVEKLTEMKKDYELLGKLVINDIKNGVPIEYSNYENFDNVKNHLAELIEYQEQIGFSETEKNEIKDLLNRYVCLFNKKVNYSNELENENLNDLIHY